MEGFKLNELSYDDEFLNALGELELRIIEDYNQFLDNDIMKKEFAESIAYIPGSKYLKVIKKIGHQTMVWGFISLKDFKKGYAGIKFKEGDILKAQGWRAPALNKPRGNVFDNNYVINWTGPKYLSGYCAGGKRNGGLL